MARFEEADERWLVKDLGSEGTNVNNWHWKEFDALEWSTKHLKNQLEGVSLLDTSAMSLRLTDVSVKGEAFINNRKNKLIPAYELEVTLGWKGELSDGSGDAIAASQGRIVLPYISDENHDEEPEIRFSGEADDSATQRLKEAFLKQGGKKLIVCKVSEFVSELRSGGPMRPGSKEAVAAEAEAYQTSKAKLSSAKPDEIKPDKAAASAAAKAKSSDGKKSLTWSETYYARPSDIYECFVIDGKVRAFTQSAATIEPRPGGKFSWFNGSVVGEFVELENNQKIVMKWRFNTWKEDCYSKVVITLESPEAGTTILKLHQTNIPEEDAFGQTVYEHTVNGWKMQIFTRIRQVFGYGI